LVDQPELERLAADLTRGDIDVPVAGELRRGGDRLLDPIDEGERRGAGVLPVRRRLMSDDEDVLVCGRPAVPAVRQVDSRRPITFAAVLA
jgi:hypothetical protein